MHGGAVPAGEIHTSRNHRDFRVSTKDTHNFLGMQGEVKALVLRVVAPQGEHTYNGSSHLSLRVHIYPFVTIRKHSPLYQRLCAERDITMHERAIASDDSTAASRTHTTPVRRIQARQLTDATISADGERSASINLQQQNLALRIEDLIRSNEASVTVRPSQLFRAILN